MSDLQQPFDWEMEGDGTLEPMPLVFDSGSGGEESAPISSVGRSSSEGSEASEQQKKRPADPRKNSWDEIPAITRRKKHKKGLPKRPLSAYNLFFQAERPKILESGSYEGRRLSFEELGKIIGQRWREISTADREQYEELAVQDSLRYRNEMEAYNNEKKKKIANIDKVQLEQQPTTNEPNSPSPFQPRLSSQPTAESYKPPNSSPSRNGAPSMYSVHASPESRDTRSPQSGFPLPFPQAGPSHTTQPYLPQGEQARPQGHYCHPQAPSLGVPVMSSLHSSTSFPPPHPVHPSFSTDAVDRDLFPIPPGMELMLPDRNGRERKFKVQYACYKMTREAAQDYIDRLTGAITQRSTPPLPPPSTSRVDSLYAPANGSRPRQMPYHARLGGNTWSNY